MNYLDVITFALADAFLWQCGEPHIHKLFKQYVAPCAGHRFICIGDYAQDLPENLCNVGELYHLGRMLGVGDDLAESIPNDDPEKDVKLLHPRYTLIAGSTC
jgi:hypothetical protein